MNFLNKKKIIFIIVASLLVTFAIFAINHKVSPIAWNPWGRVNTSANVAIKGYDPVSYHRQGKALQGTSINSFNWQDVDWHFVSQENKKLFQNSPEKYAPKYGGYCAYAVSMGITADVDPKIWHIHDNKLYLFGGQDPKSKWINDIDKGIVEQGDHDWDNL